MLWLFVSFWAFFVYFNGDAGLSMMGVCCIKFKDAEFNYVVWGAYYFPTVMTMVFAVFVLWSSRQVLAQNVWGSHTTTSRAEILSRGRTAIIYFGGVWGLQLLLHLLTYLNVQNKVFDNDRENVELSKVLLTLFSVLLVVRSAVDCFAFYKFANVIGAYRLM